MGHVHTGCCGAKGKKVDVGGARLGKDGDSQVSGVYRLLTHQEKADCILAVAVVMMAIAIGVLLGGWFKR